MQQKYADKCKELEEVKRDNADLRELLNNFIQEFAA
jgi:hypothetical protein